MSDFIKEVWDSQARQFGQSNYASWGDIEMINLEVQNLIKFIPKNSIILDIGCANGFSTKMIAERVSPSQLFAADFSQEMVNEAVRLLGNITGTNVKVFQSDIRAIELASESVDVCLATRTIINLPTWGDQIKGIEECLRVTKMGGVVLLSEGFWEPLVKLNALRQIFGLTPLAEHDFNRYIKQDKLEVFLRSRGLNYEIVEYSSLYYFGSRIARELATDYLSFEGYSNPINSEFATLAHKYPKCGGIGIQQLVVIKKLGSD